MTVHIWVIWHWRLEIISYTQKLLLITTLFDKKRKLSLYLSADSDFEINDNYVDEGNHLLAELIIRQIHQEKKEEIIDGEFNNITDDFKTSLTYVYFNNKTETSRKVV